MSKKNNLNDPTPATHGDLNIWGGKLQADIQEVRDEVKGVKEELTDRMDGMQNQMNRTQSQMNRMEGKIDKLFIHIDKRIDHYVENRASDLLGVKHDEVHLMKQQVKDHETRITALEW